MQRKRIKRKAISLTLATILAGIGIFKGVIPYSIKEIQRIKQEKVQWEAKRKQQKESYGVTVNFAKKENFYLIHSLKKNELSFETSFKLGSKLSKLSRKELLTKLKHVSPKKTKLSKSQQEKNKKIFAPLIKKIAKKYGVPEELMFKLYQHESSWDPNAIGNNKDIGLGQLTPVLWNSSLHKEYNCNPFNPKENIEVSTRYFSYLLKKFKNPLIALTAYNEGETIVIRKIKQGKSPSQIARENSNQYAFKVLAQKV